MQLGFFGKFREKNLRQRTDAGERVIEFVRDVARKQADRGHLLALHDAPVEFARRGHVDVMVDHVRDHVVTLHADRVRVDLERLVPALDLARLRRARREGAQRRAATANRFLPGENLMAGRFEASAVKMPVRADHTVIDVDDRDRVFDAVERAFPLVRRVF